MSYYKLNNAYIDKYVSNLNVQVKENWESNLVSENLLIDNKISIVIPVYGEDDFYSLEKILFKTFNKFLDISTVHYIYLIIDMTQQHFADKLINMYQNLPIKIIDQDTICTKSSSGWRFQQILKLASCNIVNTKWYLLLDSDFFLTRRCGFNELIINDRALIDLTTSQCLWSGKKKWCDNTYKIISPKSKNSNIPMMSVTPQIFNKFIVNDLLNYISETYNENWCNYLNKHSFTEYILYWTYLTNNYNPSDYYIYEYKCAYAKDDDLRGCTNKFTRISGNRIEKSVKYIKNLHENNTGPINDAFDKSFLENIEEDYYFSLFQGNVSKQSKNEVSMTKDDIKYISDYINKYL